ncbi:MAG: XRE family transcriptional regulator [Rhodospirillaceae bacterium]|nr:MAG: XRE family transcriptional regulator [Rhodospirillaceae bacterium]
MDMRKVVGRNLKKLRTDRGLSQEAFAEKSGFSQQYISGMETGVRNPSIVVLYEMSVALGVGLEELIRTGKK